MLIRFPLLWWRELELILREYSRTICMWSTIWRLGSKQERWLRRGRSSRGAIMSMAFVSLQFELRRCLKSLLLLL